MNEGTSGWMKPMVYFTFKAIHSAGKKRMSDTLTLFIGMSW